MKAKICLFFYLITLGCAIAIDQVSDIPGWKVTLKVADESGQPVANAKTTVDYLSKDQITGFTDTNGIFIASHRDETFALAFEVKKDGYYSFWQRYEMGFPSQYVKAKWNPTIGIELKRIVNPIPMYAKQIDMDPPADNKPVGYDLMVGDWVGPYGKGVTTDIVFKREYNRKSLQDYDYKLTVSFPKEGDGIQEFLVPHKIMEGSVLRSPHRAPTNGYLPQITRLNISHPGQKLIFDYDKNRVYLFRVRTMLDHESNVMSTHYGKIYGDFMQFSYYLNPTPNSRNIEFDPKQNLMKSLKPDEGVSEP